MLRYDLDNSGAIDKVEMVKVMEAIYSMVDGNMKVKFYNAASFSKTKFRESNTQDMTKNCQILSFLRRRHVGEEQKRRQANTWRGFSR